MENINMEEIDALENEVKRIIDEFEEEQAKNKVLIEENSQLKKKVEKTELYKQKIEQLEHEIQTLKTKGNSGVSELNSQDISEIMVAAKVAANQMVKKAEKEAQEFELTKKAALETVKAEGELFQADLMKIKNKIEMDLGTWMAHVDDLSRDQSTNLKSK